MQEIRLHGRGGQGLVKASHLVVKTAVETGRYGQFIPFFGVERKGSPVFGFLRLSGEPIRRKTQVYAPDVLVVLDDTPARPARHLRRAEAGRHGHSQQRARAGRRSAMPPPAPGPPPSWTPRA